MPDIDDVTSLAAVHHRVAPAQPGVADLPEAALQDTHMGIVDPESGSEDSSDESPSPQVRAAADEDWRFVHVCLLGKRSFHGRLPWRQPHIIMDAASELTGVPLDDIVHLHYVKHGPADLRAAHVEPLIAQVFSDLPLGSVHRLVMLDIEFHEQPPENEVSVSRRCLTLPRVLTRGALLRLVGLSVYCGRVHGRCLAWHNGDILLAQSVAPFVVSHVDYFRVAVPPWPFAPAHISTRACVSRIRQQPRRMAYDTMTTHSTRDHEDGMSIVDSYIDAARPVALGDDDRMALLQLSAEVSDSVHDEGSPQDKINADHAQCQRRIAEIGRSNFRPPEALPAHPAFLHDLYELLFTPHLVTGERLPPEFVLEVWYSDHLRRPHSGLSRPVRLQGDFANWLQQITLIWDDWIDPFVDLQYFLVRPQPLDGQADVHAHIVLVQRASVDRRSLIVAVSDSDDDPWHPRLLCLVVPALLAHDTLKAFVDLDHRCDPPLSVCHCATWWGDREMTDSPPFPVEHGVHLVFSLRRRDDDLSEHASLGVEHAQDALAHDSSADSASFLQVQCSRLSQRLHLPELVPPPQRTIVDCQKALFLREQLRLGFPVCPEVHVDTIWWHPVTWSWLRSMPRWLGEPVQGLSFYTDGSASYRNACAAAGVVLLVHTGNGIRWGGFASAPCIGAPTAPRAEATALLLAALWLHHLTSRGVPSNVWFELIYDCAHTAAIAQGLQAATANQQLHMVVRSLFQWLDIVLPTSLTWTHCHSHHADPWNEAADRVCKHAMRSQAYTMDLVDFYDTFTFMNTDWTPVQWLWLVEKSARAHSDAPLLLGHQWHFDVGSPFAVTPQAELHPAVLRRSSSLPGDVSPGVLSLRVATANVLTLHPDSASASSCLGARAEALAEQFVHAGIHVVGLQETRIKMAGHALFGDFHAFSGPATSRGHGGVQLWIRRTISTPQGPVKVDVADLRILHATSRRLGVRWAHAGCRLIFVVVHAPNEEDESVLETFWEATTNAIPSTYRRWPTVVLADANSRGPIKLILRMAKALIFMRGC